MSKRRIRNVGSFHACTPSGQRVEVHVFATEEDASTLVDTQDRWVETTRGYRLANGTPVNQAQDGTLTNAATGQVLVRE